MKTLYEQDFCEWSLAQASYLRNGEISKLDIEHLIEEIETLGAPDKRAFVSHLCNYLMHMLKIIYQPEKHTKSWNNTIKISLHRMKRILRDNPSFKSSFNQFLLDAYEDAIFEASKETGLDEEVFPKECPWTIEEILEGDQK